MHYPSKLIEEAVDAFARFPGIGRRTALRMALHLLKEDSHIADSLASSVTALRHQSKFCQRCGNLADATLCDICRSNVRDQSLVCVVADLRDVIAIESTEQYRGRYHLLNGLITPMDGIGPEQLNIDSLLQASEEGSVKEVIFALSSSMEGETTAFYLGRKLEALGIPTTNLARGIALGANLEYTDELTLGRAIAQRTPYSTHSKD